MKNLILIAFFISTLNSYAQENKCANFKTGNFEYSAPKYAEWNITRTDSTQIEISTKTGIEIYNSVKWLNNCEYILTCNKVVNPTSENIIGRKFTVKIIKTFPNKYVCILKNDDIDDMELEMAKVE